MIENIINNITDNDLKLKINNHLKVNPAYINNFINSSPYAYSLFLNYPELLEDFFYFQNEYLKKIQNISANMQIKKIEKKYIDLDEYLNSLLDKYPEINNSINYESLFYSLRDIKNKEMLIIGINDYFELNSLKETTFLLSNLADFCIKKAIDASLMKFKDNISIDIDTLKNNIFIIGMGKLGGEELNFSSDIDLIFFSNNEFLQKEENFQFIKTFIKNFLDFLRETSSKGFLYRVDLRLRPEGNTGPIIIGIKSAIEYYKNRALNWEYQALIKCRLIWGSQQLYKEFQDSLAPLIYSHIPPQNIL